MNEMTSTLVRLAKDKKKNWKQEAKHHNVSLNKYIIMRVEGEYIEQPAQKINKNSKIALKRIKNNYHQIITATKLKYPDNYYRILNEFQNSMSSCFQKLSIKLKSKKIDDNITSQKINSYGHLVNKLAFELNNNGFVLPIEYTDLCIKFEKLLGELS